MGVFDGTRLLAECADADAAEEYRSDLLELNVPEGFRMTAYNEGDVFTAEVPEHYDLFGRTIRGLRRSREQDRSIVTAFRWLRLAQWERAMIRRMYAKISEECAP